MEGGIRGRGREEVGDDGVILVWWYRRVQGVYLSKGDARLLNGTMNREADGKSMEEVSNNDEN